MYDDIDVPRVINIYTIEMYHTFYTKANIFFCMYVDHIYNYNGTSMKKHRSFYNHGMNIIIISLQFTNIACTGISPKDVQVGSIEFVGVAYMRPLLPPHCHSVDSCDSLELTGIYN